MAEWRDENGALCVGLKLEASEKEPEANQEASEKEPEAKNTKTVKK